MSLQKNHQTFSTLHNTNSPFLIIWETKIYQIQTLNGHMNSNLLAYAYRHIRWLDKFPETLAPAAKLQEAARIVCNSFKPSNDFTESEDHLLFKH